MSKMMNTKEVQTELTPEMTLIDSMNDMMKEYNELKKEYVKLERKYDTLEKYNHELEDKNSNLFLKDTNNVNKIRKIYNKVYDHFEELKSLFTAGKGDYEDFDDLDKETYDEFNHYIWYYRRKS